MGFKGVQIQSHGVVAGFFQAMTVWLITLISTMVTHHVIASSATSTCSTSTLSSFHGIHSLLPSVAFIHLLLSWSCTSSTA